MVYYPQRIDPKHHGRKTDMKDHDNEQEDISQQKPAPRESTAEGELKALKIILDCLPRELLPPLGGK